MKTIQKEVRKFKRANSIKEPPNMHELMDLIHRKYGFTTYGYYKDVEKLHETKTYELSLDRPAFSYCKNGKSYVFYNDTLNEKDVAHLLAHELGHLHYNHLHRHTDSADTPIQKEWQANIFAAYLMEPKDYKSYIRKAILPSVLVVASFFCGTLYPMDSSPSVSLPEEQAIITTSQTAPMIAEDEADTDYGIDNAEDIVFVAKSGTVYHTSNTCSHIKGHDGIRKMTLNSAEEANLPLCSRCKSKMK